MNKYFDKVNILPRKITTINHRSECNPYYGDKLPIFTAPMSCVVNDENYEEFIKMGVTPIIPRNVPFEKRLELYTNKIWTAFGLDEFESLIRDSSTIGLLPITDGYICVDLANGHMKKLIDMCKLAKFKYPDLTIMTGNIAYSETYNEYASAGIDYIRVSIGSGSGCATNDLTGIGMSPIELLTDVTWRKNSVASSYNSRNSRYKTVPKVIFDGGCSSVRDIIIALAMGADYVMCGKIFAQSKEACGLTRCKDGIEYRQYYGMSTEKAQKEIGNITIKHSEGKEFYVEVLYSLEEWVSQFVAAIRSTMSYCDARTLYDFIGKVDYRYER